MPRLTLFEFLNTYAPDREFVPIAGQKMTVGEFMDSLTAEEKAEEVTYQGHFGEGVSVFLGEGETGRLGMVVWHVNARQTPAFQEPADYTKARFWAMNFMKKVEEIETLFYASAHHTESLIAYKGKDEARRQGLRELAEDARTTWKKAREELFAWVVANPAPEGADKLI